MLSPELKGQIGKLWDKFWSRGIANPITAIEQISYLLFMRRIDEMDRNKLRESVQTNENYRSVFSSPKLDRNGKPILDANGDLVWEDNSNLRWVEFSKISDPHHLLKVVRDQAFPFIKKINKKVDLSKIRDTTLRTKVKAELYGSLTDKEIEQEFAYVRYMSTATFSINNPNLMKEAIDDVNIIYDEIRRQQIRGEYFQDTQGDVYEYLLNELSQSGKNGQFRTPRHIIQFMCEILDPDWEDIICDPACGTGGFLLGAYQHILTKYTSEQFLQKDENGFIRGIVGDQINNNEIWEKLKEKTFYGFDIDQNMVRIGLMNLMLHDISIPHIENIDTLSSAYEAHEKQGKYSIILANPPFTGRINKEEKSDLLRIDGSQSELLFIDRIIHMLKPKGKAGVIIPEGVLFGSGKAQRQTREILLKDNVLEAVISLPAGAFQPYTGVKTAILIFTKVKLESAKWQTKKVWFYNLESDGYSLDSNRKRLKDEPLPIAVNHFKTKTITTEKDRKSNHFYVPLSTIQENDLDLSFNRYREFSYSVENYDPPKKILQMLLHLEEEISKDLNELNGMIK